MFPMQGDWIFSKYLRNWSFLVIQVWAEISTTQKALSWSFSLSSLSFPNHSLSSILFWHFNFLNYTFILFFITELVSSQYYLICWSTFCLLYQESKLHVGRGLFCHIHFSSCHIACLRISNQYICLKQRKQMGFGNEFLDMTLLWDELCLSKLSYGDALTSRTSKCYYIWKQGL